jgi:hypothetical protein
MNKYPFYLFFLVFSFFIIYSADYDKILYTFTSDSEDSKMINEDEKNLLITPRIPSEHISHLVAKEEKNKTEEEEGWSVDIKAGRFKNKKKISFLNIMEKSIALHRIKDKILAEKNISH